MHSSRTPWIGLVLIAITTIAAAYWFFAPPSVLVVGPRIGPAIQAIYATGTVEPVVMIPVAPRIGARIVHLAVDEGAVVKAGEVLARLESEDVRSNVLQLVAQEDFAHRDYLRNRSLVNEGVISRQVFEKSRSAWLAADAAVKSAQAQSSYMTLVAPTDGRIIRRDGEVGQFLPVNQPLFWMSDLLNLRISAEVDEEDIAKVRPGQNVLIRADAFPGRIFNGVIQQITPKGDPVARSYRVRISLNAKTPFQIGMTTETNIITYEKPRALLIPASALFSNTVWIIRNGRVTRQAVEKGVAGNTEVEIVRGLTPKDKIVVNPDSLLTDGMVVNVVQHQNSK